MTSSSQTQSSRTASASTTTTLAAAAPAGNGGSSLSGSTSAAPAASNASPAFSMPLFGAPTAAAALSTTVTASTISAATAAVGHFSSMFPSTAASSSSSSSSTPPFSTIMASAFPFGTGTALSNTTASFTQTAATASASTSSSTTTSSTFSFGTPSSSPYGFGGTSDPLSSPALTKRGATGFASTVTTMGPVPPESTAPATASSTIKSAVTTGLLFSPAPRKPLFSGIGEATGFTSTVTTTTPVSSAPGLFSLQAASSACSTPSITTSKQEPEPVVLKVADSEFYDFDRDKTVECFTADQIWAVYDYLDLMPRGYARINKVYSPFKVDLTWLEFFARDINETAWKRSVLPVACGKFIHSVTATTENIRAFSHKIFWTRRVNKIYNIYPQKGETWALYKNWNIKWSSDAGNHREYEYEFVVVLSYYTKKSGILVDPLVNLKGFVCLFKPTKNNGMGSFQIPSNEMLRFSHRVPSYRTNGKERKDVPEGCFELDTYSLPTNLEEVSGFIDTEDETVDFNVNGSLKSVSRENPMPKKRKNSDAESSLDGSSAGGNKSSRISNGCYKNSNEEKRAAEAFGRPLDKSKATDVSDGKKIAIAHTKGMSPDGVNTIRGSVDEDIPSSPSSSKIFEMPVTRFCNFGEQRSCEKFKTGQIWALYCKLDKLPRNYAQIESVESLPVFKLAVKLLKSCDPPRGIIPWVDKEMPVSCGTFKATSGEVVVFNNFISFSHQLTEVPVVHNVYTIYPRAGEVWALYSKFRFDLTCSDLKKCEYNIVEVLEVVDVHWIIVSVLQRVTGLMTVFKAKENEGLDSVAAVPWIELYRFSHQVPTFMLSGARYGKLRGCWELDPRSLAVY